MEPLIEKLNRTKIDFAFELNEKLNSINPTKTAHNQAADVIYCLLDDAFTVIEPNEKEQDLYDQYAPVSFEEEKNNQLSTMKDEMQTMLSQVLGKEVDLSDVDL